MDEQQHFSDAFSGENAQPQGILERLRISPLLINATVLIGILFVYMLAGGLATLLAAGVNAGSVELSDLKLAINDGNLQMIRLVQFLAQVLIIGLPVLFLVPLHTGNWQVLSQENRRFLGLEVKASPMEFIYAALGIIVIHPFLAYSADLQITAMDVIFGVGDTLLAERKMMDEFIEKLTVMRSPAEFLGVAGLIAVTPAICEELLFRGYVLKNFSRSLSAGLTVFLTGLIFGAYHLNASETLPLVILGIYISFVRYYSGALSVAMTIHFVNNFFSVSGVFVLSHADFFHINPSLLESFESRNPDISSASAIFSAGLSLALFFIILNLYKTAVQKRFALGQ
ncbi:Abortive infection protein [Chloroherpeton thalassium ATCC 35110]|uniref:Abortive infection protein n=1 Tax=Chloroherpeton thalassium (strain ATCC 35110 / GB-78) TaxID=517418 RepID=B3QS91_CHLT3|nr:CPBP family intramembrane glutamic endopeptidase [Chloroherpeton thalassium]ACF12482.1 Abortive infection protein [Chloroherpeton thalassium ATCC 35110]